MPTKNCLPVFNQTINFVGQMVDKQEHLLYYRTADATFLYLGLHLSLITRLLLVKRSANHVTSEVC